jgi:hypothetical protein
MANLIDTVEIAGAAVYGVRQVTYTVDGAAGKDYGAALTAAAFKESTAIEDTMNSYAAVVRPRMRKLEDLGTVMAGLNAGMATLKTKETESSDKTDKMAVLAEAHTLAAKYGITVTCVAYEYSGGVYKAQMRRDDLYRAQNQVQYEMDKEDNDLKQDMVALNSLMSKRDNAFSAAARLIKKANDAASSTIGNIGG